MKYDLFDFLTTPFLFRQLNSSTPSASILSPSTSISLQKNFTQENFEHYRSLRTTTPVFKFDFKSGVYINDDSLVKFKHLLPSFTAAVKTGKVKSHWFFSDEFAELFFNYTQEFLNSSSHSRNLPLFANKNLFNSNFDVFIYLFNFLKDERSFSFKNLSFLSLNQKFESMFLNTTIQQRVFNN